MKLASQINLSLWNSFGVHVSADYVSFIKNRNDITTICPWIKEKKLPFFILGGGSNILFTRNFYGVILKNEIKGIEIIQQTADTIYIEVCGGENWHEFVLFCVKNNWQGIENLSLIPGTVGAAPIQNIGAFGVELHEVFHYLKAYHIYEEKWYRFTKKDCNFGYRDSIFKKELKNTCFITSVCFALNKKNKYVLSYPTLQELKEKKNVTIKEISDKIIDIRKNKLPITEKNAGSFFQNPIISKEKYETLKKEHPQIHSFETPCGRIKISAAWLIETCGWKGKKVSGKDIGVYKKHALILVNYGNGNGKDIYELSSSIIASVKKKFSITLQREVNIL